jgi:hypothetical protein
LVEITESYRVTCPEGDLGLLPMGDRNEVHKLQSPDPVAVRQRTPRGMPVRYKIPDREGLWIESHDGDVMAWAKPRTVWRHWCFSQFVPMEVKLSRKS